MEISSDAGQLFIQNTDHLSIFLNDLYILIVFRTKI